MMQEKCDMGGGKNVKSDVAEQNYGIGGGKK
jgi:hypothetical protein